MLTQFQLSRLNFNYVQECASFRQYNSYADTKFPHKKEEARMSTIRATVKNKAIHSNTTKANSVTQGFIQSFSICYKYEGSWVNTLFLFICQHQIAEFEINLNCVNRMKRKYTNIKNVQTTNFNVFLCCGLSCQ